MPPFSQFFLTQPKSSPFFDYNTKTPVRFYSYRRFLIYSAAVLVHAVVLLIGVLLRIGLILLFVLGVLVIH